MCRAPAGAGESPLSISLPDDAKQISDTTVYTGRRFIDKRPLLVDGNPEVREYRLRFWEDDKPIGDWTPIASVTVSP